MAAALYRCSMRRVHGDWPPFVVSEGGGIPDGWRVSQAGEKVIVSCPDCTRRTDDQGRPLPPEPYSEPYVLQQSVPRCNGCDARLPDAATLDRCPHCGSEDATVVRVTVNSREEMREAARLYREGR